MRALLSHAAGGPETLRLGELPDPTAGPGEVLIAVRACGVNFPDVLVIEDKYQFRQTRPFAPGGEVAGVIEVVGAGVEGFAIGDRVIAIAHAGGMAERIAVPVQACTPMPAAMAFEEAAALLFTYGTSRYALEDRARLRSGETLLVLGAAGGVGLAAVELGRAMGAHVIAAASSQDKVDLALGRGAERGVVYPAAPDDPRALSALFKEACGPEGPDVIYDPVGGAYSEAALRAIAWEGRHLVVGFPSGIPRLPLNLALLKSCQVVGVMWGGWARRYPEANAANNRALVALYEAGKVRPHVSERYPLERGSEAIARLAARQARGKIVVTIP